MLPNHCLVLLGFTFIVQWILCSRSPAGSPFHLLLWLPPFQSLDRIVGWSVVFCHRVGVDRSCAG